MALATVISMACSYHALGTSVLAEKDIEESSRFVVAIEHHLNALEFTSEAQKLVEAATLANNLSSLSAAREENTLVGHVMNMRKVTTRGRDLSVVSLCSAGLLTLSSLFSISPLTVIVPLSFCSICWKQS